MSMEKEPTKPLLKEARAHFLQASDRYAEGGVRLSRGTIAQLEPYYDRAEGRAAVIQRFAQDLADAIKDFDRVHPMLAELVAMLLLQVAQRSLVAGAEALAAAGQKVLQVGSDQSNYGLDDKELEAIDELVALEDLGARIENEAAFAIEVSADLFALREGELKRYLDAVPHVSGMSVLGKLTTAAAKEGTLQAVGTGLEALAKAVGTQVPVANVVLGVYQVGQDLRDKVSAMEAHYRRSPIDSMFEMAERIDGQQQVSKAAIELLIETRKAIAEI